MDRSCRLKCNPGLRAIGWVLSGLPLMAFALIAALPTPAQAAECNINTNLTYTKAHPFLLPPEQVTVNAQLFTGTITTDTATVPLRTSTGSASCSNATVPHLSG